MHTDPEKLLLLARKAGLTLFRQGSLVIVKGKGAVPSIWLETLKRHKPDLLPLLPNAPPNLERPKPIRKETAPGETYDLFGPVPPRPPRRRNGKRRATASTES
jgi:hypothetical protein